MSENKSNKKVLLKEFIMLGMVHEAPIGEFEFVGNRDKNTNFNRVDKEILTNPRSVEKIKKKWNNTTETYNMWFLNDPKYIGREFKEKGKISRDQFRKMTNSNIPDSELDDGINIVFNGNSAAQKVQMSPWILAHRFGHALQRDNVYLKAVEYFQKELAEILNQWARYETTTSFYLNKIETTPNRPFNKDNVLNDQRPNKDNKALVRNFLQQIGTFKSARDENLPRLNEFLHECFAQCILTGEVKFNELPDTFKTGTSGWGKSLRPVYQKLGILDLEELNDTLQGLARTLTIEFNGVLGNCIGNVYLI